VATVADGRERIDAGLTRAVSGPGRGPAVADQLCWACIDLLGVQGAALWLMTDRDGPLSLSRCGTVTAGLEMCQLSSGQGPGRDAMEASALISTPDLSTLEPGQWPTFAAAAADLGIRAVFAVPVAVAGAPAGVLFLCRDSPGGLTEPELAGAFLAAELAALPLLDVLADNAAPAVQGIQPSAESDFGWLPRAEVYQAVGIIAAQLGVPAAEALLRLRGYAFANDMNVYEVALRVIKQNLRLEDDRSGGAGRPEPGDRPGRDGTA
jgi:hypothetical protein